jgi:hypothetical protein
MVEKKETAEKKEIDWKSALVTLVPAVLSSGLIITGLSTFFSDIYNKPDLQISTLPIESGTTWVNVTNDGRVPATNLTLFIRTPENILNRSNFTTEKIAVSELDPKQLRVDIPRLVQGGGSMVRMNLTTDTKQDTNNQSVIVHAVYDQGSETNEKVIHPLIFLFSNPLVSVIVGLVTLVGTLFIYRNYKQRRSRYILRRLTTKLDLIIRRDAGKERYYNLERLHELRIGAGELFSKGRLFESHFKIFEERYRRLVFEIFYTVLADRDLSIFGEGFGEIAGIVIIDGKKSEIRYWSQNRVDVTHPDTVQPESTLTLIKNTGILKSGQIREFNFSPV